MSDLDTSKMPAGLAALLKRSDGAGRSFPPVERWNPPFCGDLDIRIATDGTWSYLGSVIGRESLVRLFASVLRKDEDGRHYLVTPVEKIGITVEDSAFIAVELYVDGDGKSQKLTLRTNVGDVIDVDDEHPLRFLQDAENSGLKPYVGVRGRLEARLSRPLLYELAELFVEEDLNGKRETGVWSAGIFFPLDLSDAD